MKENQRKQQLIHLIFLGTLSISQAVKLGLKLEDDEGLFSKLNWQNAHLENIGSVKRYFKDSPSGYVEHIKFDDAIKREFGSESNYFKDKRERMRKEANHLSHEADHQKSTFPISDKNLDVNFEKDSIFRNKVEANKKKKEDFDKVFDPNNIYSVTNNQIVRRASDLWQSKSLS